MSLPERWRRVGTFDRAALSPVCAVIANAVTDATNRLCELTTRQAVCVGNADLAADYVNSDVANVVELAEGLVDGGCAGCAVHPVDAELARNSVPACLLPLRHDALLTRFLQRARTRRRGCARCVRRRGSSRRFSRPCGT